MDYSSNNSLRKRLRDGNNTIEEVVFQCQSCKREVCNHRGQNSKQINIEKIHLQIFDMWCKNVRQMC